MAESAFAGKEELQELKSKGIVFSSPLASRSVVLAALAGSAVAGWEWVASAPAPDTVPAMIELARRVGLAAVVLCAVAAGATLVFALACNGFTLSAGFLSLRLRPVRRERVWLALASVLLGTLVGYLLAYSFAGELFLLLRAGDAASLGASFGRLALRFAKVVALGALGVAVLVALASRARFLWLHRPRKGARE